MNIGTALLMLLIPAVSLGVVALGWARAENKRLIEAENKLRTGKPVWLKSVEELDHARQAYKRDERSKRG